MVTPKKSQRVGTKKPINGTSPAVEVPLPEVVEPKVEVEVDLVLELSHAGLSHKVRANTAILKAKSAYFTNLFSSRFDEGSRLENAHARLREKYERVSAAPPEELPVIRIEDLGRLSEVKSIAALCNDFFNVAWNQSTAGSTTACRQSCQLDHCRRSLRCSGRLKSMRTAEEDFEGNR